MTEENTNTADPTPGVGSGREYPGMPRWVKVSAIILIGLVLLVVAVLLVTSALGLHTPGGPGGHGPNLHIPSGDAGDTPFAGVRDPGRCVTIGDTPPWVTGYGGQQL